jgi:hypothetical protein
MLYFMCYYVQYGMNGIGMSIITFTGRLLGNPALESSVFRQGFFATL